jgi:hypothetical protein
MRRYNSSTGAAEGYIQIMGNGVDDVKYNGNVMWHAGNDGSGSGLDADLLDGADGAFFRNASNLNAGTVPDARISGAYSGITTLSTTGLHTVTTAGEALRVAGPSAADDPYITFYAGGVRTAYIQHTDGTGTGAGFRMLNDVTDDYLYLSNVGDVDALKFYDSSTNAHRNVWHTGNLTLADLGGASSSTSVTAGNGLTGGGTLAASRTLTLGTPSNITNSTTNSVTSTSHTHALGFMAAEVYTGSNASETNYPIGTVLFVALGGTRPDNNSTTTVRLSGTNGFVIEGTTTALGGTWRARGGFTASGDRFGIYQKVA